MDSGTILGGFKISTAYLGVVSLDPSGICVIRIGVNELQLTCPRPFLIGRGNTGESTLPMT